METGFRLQSVGGSAADVPSPTENNLSAPD